MSVLSKELNWDDLRSELLIHIGRTGYRTKKALGTRRDDTSQLGYDIKFGYDISDFRPFLTLHGHWAISGTHTKIGLGTFYFLKKSEFQLDFTRKREKLLDINGEKFQDDVVLYKTRLLWSYKIKTFEKFELKSMIGLGTNTHGEKKLFKFNRGEYYLAGIRFQVPDDLISNEAFLYELYWQQDTIRSTNLRQERNSVILRLGKRF